MPFTQTVITVPAATSTLLIAANPRRDYLAFQNIGAGDANLGFAGSASADTGWSLDAASAAGRQGGSMVWEGSSICPTSVYAYSTVGTSIVVLEG